MSRCIRLSIAALLASACAAQAEPLIYSSHSATVNYEARENASVVLARIERAADRVCGGRVEAGNYYSAEQARQLNRAYEICFTNAVRNAVATTNSRAVAELYADRGEQLAGR